MELSETRSISTEVSCKVRRYCQRQTPHVFRNKLEPVATGRQKARGNEPKGYTYRNGLRKVDVLLLGIERLGVVGGSDRDAKENFANYGLLKPKQRPGKSGRCESADNRPTNWKVAMLKMRILTRFECGMEERKRLGIS